MNFKQLNLSQKIFSLVIIAFTITNNINSASQAHVQSSSSAGSGSFGGWLKSWFVSAPTEQQKKIATIVGERAAERQKKLANVLYDATLLPEDLIKIIIVYDEKIFTQHTGAITALAVLSNGKLASASKDKSIKIWDVARDRCTQTLIGHMKKVTTLAVLGDNQLVSGASDFSIKIWDTDSGQCKKTIKTSDGKFLSLEGILCLTILSNNRVAFVSEDDNESIKILDLTTERTIQSFSTKGSVTTLATFPNGNLLAGHSEQPYSGEYPMDDKDGHSIIDIWDIKNKTLLQSLNSNHYFVNIGNLAPLSNYQFLSAGQSDSRILVRDITNEMIIKEFNLYSSVPFSHKYVLALAILPNAQLASGWSDGTIRIIDLDTMQCIHTLKGHTGAVTALATLQNGKLASGSEDETIRVWNLEQEEHKE